MVSDTPTLAGRSNSSRVQDFPLGFSCVGCKGPSLSTPPDCPNRSPFAAASQVTLFAGQGLKGHSVPKRTAAIATTEKIPMRFFSTTACDSSFTSDPWKTRSVFPDDGSCRERVAYLGQVSDALAGQAVKRGDRHFQMLFARVLNFIVADAAHRLHEHHHGRNSRAGHFRGAVQGT